MVRAGIPEEIRPDSGEWLFIDAGFSSNGRSCGVLAADDVAVSLTFSEAANRLVRVGAVSAGPLNLLIEAPLSVAFNSKGNPVGRSIERLGSSHRYWYEGLGCLVMTSAMYLLRNLADSQPAREVRLFEGFVSFKQKGRPSSHCEDVLALRAIVRDVNRDRRTIVTAAELAIAPSDQVASAFRVAGLDFGVPPVLRVIGAD
jgi:hypothetical protein